MSWLRRIIRALPKRKRVWITRVADLRGGILRAEREVPMNDIVGINYYDKDRHVGYVWLSVDEHYAFLWFIFIRDNERRKGYALEMIKDLQSRYREIQTHYLSTLASAPSTQLLLKAGFRIVPQLHNRKPGYIVWQKKN